METSLFDYNLPHHLIAQTPQQRGTARMMHLSRSTGLIRHETIADLPDHFAPGDVLVLNETRVSARRFDITCADGTPGELLALRTTGNRCWLALMRPGRKLKPHARFMISSGSNMLPAVVDSVGPGGVRTILLASDRQRDSLTHSGRTPLPPYITQPLVEEEQYQTVYSRVDGSAAAPTAGLHLTDAMLNRITSSGVQIARIVLHIGLDTFRPVKEAQLEQHQMHGEWYSISGDAAECIQHARGRIIAVGTTVVRALESCVAQHSAVVATSSETTLFITPGFRFKVVDALLTNFHLPRSTLLALVSAFAGTENTLNAYEQAVRNYYKFYSFGDAMLIT